MPVTLGGYATAANLGSGLTTASTGAMSVAPTAGSTISVAVVWSELTNCTSVTDTAGNTYVSAGAKFGSGSKYMQYWYAKDCLSHASNVVTANFSAGSNQVGISAVEVKGAHLTTPLGLYGGNQQGTGVTTTDGTTSGARGTPSQDGHFIHAVSTTNGGPSSYAVGTGLTLVQLAGTGNYKVCTGYAIQTTAAAVEALFTQNSTASTTTGVATYRPAPGPVVDTQPTALTAVLVGPASNNPATFTVAATTSGGSLIYDWELETSVGGGGYANLSDGNGATWTGQTSASCSATLTATTLSGRRVRCNVTDDNGTTTTNAVVLTIREGTTIAQPAATDGSGVATAVLTTDVADTANGALKLITFTRGSTVLRTTARKTS